LFSETDTERDGGGCEHEPSSSKERAVRSRLIVVTALLLVAAAPTAAQWVDPSTCAQGTVACDSARREESDRDASNKEMARWKQAEREQFRRALLKQPPLPAERNGLLGSWRLDDGQQGQTAGILGPMIGGDSGADTGLGGAMADIANMVMGLEKGLCGLGFGSGVTFSPTTYSLQGEISVAYRAGLLGGKPAIAAIPGDIAQDMMVFAIASPDRIVAEDGCILVRVGRPAANSAANATTGPSATPAGELAATPFKSVREQLGVYTAASVERDIKARGGEQGFVYQGFVLQADSQGRAGWTDMYGDYSDIGPYVTTVVYDFDGTGPAARLIGVLVVHGFHVSGDEFKKLADERKAVLAKDVGVLTVKSATESSGAAGGYVLTLFEKPDSGYLQERYKLAD
jgi:hypothetical protein